MWENASPKKINLFPTLSVGWFTFQTGESWSGGEGWEKEEKGGREEQKLKFSSPGKESHRQQWSFVRAASSLCIWLFNCSSIRASNFMKFRQQTSANNIIVVSFYRTHVSLVRSLCPDVRKWDTFCRLNWCDSGWWGYQLRLWRL